MKLFYRAKSRDPSKSSVANDMPIIVGVKIPASGNVCGIGVLVAFTSGGEVGVEVGFDVPIGVEVDVGVGVEAEVGLGLKLGDADGDGLVPGDADGDGDMEGETEGEAEETISVRVFASHRIKTFSWTAALESSGALGATARFLD